MAGFGSVGVMLPNKASSTEKLRPRRREFLMEWPHHQIRRDGNVVDIHAYITEDLSSMLSLMDPDPFKLTWEALVSIGCTSEEF